MDSQTTGSDQVSQYRQQSILKLAHSGLTPEDISFALKIDIETIHRFITLDLKSRPKNFKGWR
jgi:DNA-binding NarL/FixJ family response regulator